MLDNWSARDVQRDPEGFKKAQQKELPLPSRLKRP
jgi:hypothetical protein